MTQTKKGEGFQIFWGQLMTWKLVSNRTILLTTVVVGAFKCLSSFIKFKGRGMAPFIIAEHLDRNEIWASIYLDNRKRMVIGSHLRNSNNIA
jgi:hypothetical protein